MSVSAQRYSVVAIVLHWAIAIAIVGMIALGWWMGDAIEDTSTQAQAIAAYQLHKSIGLSILALSLARLGWRLTHKVPPLPPHMPAWERLAAQATHWAFYGLMIAMPLSGWLFVSTSWAVDAGRPLEVPTLYFGLFEVTHLFGLSHLADDARALAAGVIEFIHSKLAWAAIALLALHVGAALKHHFFDQDDVLTHMLPGLKPLSGVTEAAPAAPARRAGLIAGFSVIAIAVAAAIIAFQSPPQAAPAPARQATAEASADAMPAPVFAPSPPGAPPLWRVDPAKSAIRFSGVHAGVPFEGGFSRWHAEIRFDPANLDASTAVVTIETASASDGVPLHDQSLPQTEWFNVARYPTANFGTIRIRQRSDGRYEARGVLVIKGLQIETELPFTLAIQGDRAVMEGTMTLDRAQADLGQASDPGADYVSREIGVRVHVEAVRAQ